MTNQASTEAVPRPGAGDTAPSPQGAVPKQRPLLWTMAFASFGVAALWGSMASIFLAVHLQALSPENKIGSLALAIGVGAFGAMLAAPIAGTLSDRTRTRIGGRAPWMIGGLVVSIAAVAFMAIASTTGALIVAYATLMVASNFVAAPLVAHVPDRVPSARRGVFSSSNGLGTIVGTIAGQTLAAAFSGSIQTGYLVIAVTFGVALSVFLIVNSRQSNVGVPLERFALIDLLRTFWVNPIKHPDFFWAFSGRLLIISGFYLVTAFELFILQDYIGLGDDAVHRVPLIGGVILVAFVTSTIISGPLSDKMGRRKPVILIASAILAVAVLMPFAWPTFTGFLVFAFMSGFGFGAYQSVHYALVTEVLPSQANAGRDLGIINISGTLPQTFGPAAAGLVVTFFGGYAALFPIAAVVVTIGAVSIIPIRSVR